MRHCGELNIDSPGLCALLEGVWERNQLDELYHIYNLSCGHGALDEGDVKRVEGASFNPRPARIAQILLSEGSITNPAAIFQAFLSCAKRDIFDAYPEKLKPYSSGDHSIREALGGNQANNLVAPISSIVISHLLDRLRHLHMCQYEQPKYKQYYKKINDIYKMVLQVDPSLREKPSRLITLMNAAINRIADRVIDNE